MQRVTTVGLAGGVATLVVALSACGSASGSGGGHPSASPDLATSPTRASPAECVKVAPTSFPSPTPVGPVLTEQKAARTWLRLATPANKQGLSALNALGNLENKKLTVNEFRAVAAPFVKALITFYNGIGAANWPPNVQPLVNLDFMKTHGMIGDFQLLEKASPSCIKLDIHKIFVIQTERYGISQAVRRALALPTS